MAPNSKTAAAGGDKALRRRAEKELRVKPVSIPDGSSERILHELQVHQIQLEMQNEEMRRARLHLEELVEKYTELYDFAPVGYFSLDEAGLIREVNLPGAAMLGVERAHLLRRRFSGFVAQGYQAGFSKFLSNIKENNGKQVCELAIDVKGQHAFWVDLQATKTDSPAVGKPRFRLAMSDVTARKRAAEAKLRVEALEEANLKLETEIARREEVEKSLRESRRSQALLLKQAKRMEEQLRLLSRQILHTQEEERKRISKDLHDEIAQTLVAINVHLSHLARETALNPEEFEFKIIETQKLVERSVESVHRFALGLRPTQLDDLGLVQALRDHFKQFEKNHQIPILFKSPRTLKARNDSVAAVLFRVAQASLTNVARHAGATDIKVDLRETQRFLRLEISDNGKSFDVQKALNETKVKRLGLIGMRERVEMVGGVFKITSTPGKGTTICVTVSPAKLKGP
jgi:PAS domain S-box-containing protein